MWRAPGSLVCVTMENSWRGSHVWLGLRVHLQCALPPGSGHSLTEGEDGVGTVLGMTRLGVKKKIKKMHRLCLHSGRVAWRVMGQRCDGLGASA